jgi:LPS O-antigen subunit length determinant protein (WzzB/FepE family)
MSVKKTELTNLQRLRLNQLWHLYGNNGKKHTHHNHRFIQNLIEHNEDTRKFYLNADRTKTNQIGRDWSKIELTQECIDGVDKILNNE